MAVNSGVISVIVPVYNVEKYLDRCIKSIVTQTYKKLEILIIDDGSLDSCPSICDEWGKREKRIKVIHKKNGGLSDARNVGIDRASGEYIVFVDADDYIAFDMCEKLVAAISNSQSDIAICSFYWQYKDFRRKQPMWIPKHSILTRENVLENWAKSSSTEYVVAWNKIYRKKLFYTTERIRFPVGRLHEDEFTTYKLLYAAKKIIFIDQPLYHYVQREGSIMANFSMRNFLCLADVVHDYFDWSNKYAPEKRNVIECIAMRTALGAVKKMAQSEGLPLNKKCCELIDYVKDEVHIFIFNPFATVKNKTEYLLINLGIYELIIRCVVFIKKIKCDR